MIPPIYHTFNTTPSPPNVSANNAHKRSHDQTTEDQNPQNKRLRTDTPQSTSSEESPESSSSSITSSPKLLPTPFALPPPVRKVTPLKEATLLPANKFAPASSCSSSSSISLPVPTNIISSNTKELMEQFARIYASQLSEDFTFGLLSFNCNSAADSFVMPTINYSSAPATAMPSTAAAANPALTVTIPSDDDIENFSSVPTPTLTPLVDTHSGLTSIKRYSSPEAFAKQLSEVSTLNTFEERIVAFQNLMTPLRLPVTQNTQSVRTTRQKKVENTASNSSSSGTKEAHTCLITLRQNTDPTKNVSVAVVIEKGPYFSNAFDERCFLKRKERAGKEYCRIQLFEHVGSEKLLFDSAPLMKVRACKDDGELVWIGNGKHCQSLDELGRFYLPIEEMLGVDFVLYDDAKIPLEHAKAEEGKAKLFLKASQVIGHPEATTSYQRKFGYDVANCNNWIRDATEDPSFPIKGMKFSQSQAEFVPAVQRVRQMTVKKFYEFYKTNPNGPKFAAIVARVFGNAKEKFEISSCTRTLSELEFAAAGKVKAAKTDQQKAQAQQDQYDLQHTAFWTHKAPKNASETERQYWKDINTIASTNVFIKRKKVADK